MSGKQLLNTPERFHLLPDCRVYFLALCLALLARPASAAIFSTAISDVAWNVEGSVFECRLSQGISGFGQAVFSRRAGERQAFYLKQKQILLPVGTATISLGRPAWQSLDHLPQPVAETNVVAELIALRINEPIAETLLDELLKGLRIIVTRAGEEQRNPVRVVVEPLKFRTAFKDYQGCLGKLLPVSYAEVSRTTLYFSNASDELTPDERRKLDWVALYMKEDKGIKRVLVDGHTDSLGPRPNNLEVSKARSERIAAYLVAAGIDSKRITTRWHGERYPIASNTDNAGRQKNRRVTVRLER